jgi:integrase
MPPLRDRLQRPACARGRCVIWANPKASGRRPPSGRPVAPCARRLLETVRGDRLEALYVLALNTGMRQGEFLALKWDDVDLERGVLRVRRTLTHADRAYVLGEPKTSKSRRTIRLTTGAVTALRAHLSRQLEEMEKMGSLYQPGGLIFATETGTIINPSNLSNRSFKPLLLRHAALRTSTPRSSPRC